METGTPLDAAVWQPERVDYAAGAQVEHGITTAAPL
jgi:hypothetical protein